jgi:hypothetical protein
MNTATLTVLTALRSNRESIGLRDGVESRIRLFGLIDQSASVSWADTCGWLISPRVPGLAESVP